MKNTKGENWVKVARLADIPNKGSRVFKAPDGTPIAIFRTSADDVFALKDQCPHKGGPLSEGIVHGKKVTCPLHNWVVELDSGHVMAPDEGCTQHFPIDIKDGQISICLPTD